MSRLTRDARCLGPLLLSLLGSATACHSRPEEAASSNATTTADDPHACIETAAHEVLGGSACDERSSAPCSGEGDAEAEGNQALHAILDECLLRETILNVELEQGCATRFALSVTPPDAVECVAARLAARRYDCLGDLTCVTAEVSTLR